MRNTCVADYWRENNFAESAKRRAKCRMLFDRDNHRKIIARLSNHVHPSHELMSAI